MTVPADLLRLSNEDVGRAFIDNDKDITKEDQLNFIHAWSHMIGHSQVADAAPAEAEAKAETAGGGGGGGGTATPPHGDEL